MITKLSPLQLPLGKNTIKIIQNNKALNRYN